MSVFDSLKMAIVNRMPREFRRRRMRWLAKRVVLARRCSGHCDHVTLEKRFGHLKRTWAWWRDLLARWTGW